MGERSVFTQWVAWAIMTTSAMAVSARPACRSAVMAWVTAIGSPARIRAISSSCSVSVSGAMFVS